MSGSLILRVGGFDVGRLDFSVNGQRESSVFTYNGEWVGLDRAFDLSPAMPRNGFVYRAAGHGNVSPLPGPIADCTPDSWGRAIMKIANGGGHMNDFDYLCGVDDFLRPGALQFWRMEDPAGEPVAQRPDDPERISIPRLFDLQELVHEARALEADPVHYAQNRARLMAGRLLANAGGSLGGARPKVNMRHDDGSIWIAKLPSRRDTYDMARAEVLAMRLAGELGIEVAETRVFNVDGQFPISLIRRFDRTLREDGSYGRVHMITAQTFLDLPGTEPSDYATIAQEMQIWGAAAQLPELWARMAYSVLIQNTDDHLRNHAFLAAGNIWSLSPAYDINPDPTPGMTLKTAISPDHGNQLDIQAVIDAAPYFNLGEQDSRPALKAIAEHILGRWRQLAHEIGMDAMTLRALQPAFESPQMMQAAAL